MGLDIYAVFQRVEGGIWRDIPDNYERPRHSDLYAWLGVPGYYERTYEPIAPPRGFPDDFELLEDYYHPSGTGELLLLGTRGRSWLLSSEILRAATPKEFRTVSMPIDEYRQWDDPEYHPWQWASNIWWHNVGVPDSIVTDNEKVVFGWDYDLAEDFAYFLDEVRRLDQMHDEVRFIYSFE